MFFFFLLTYVLLQEFPGAAYVCYCNPQLIFYFIVQIESVKFIVPIFNTLTIFNILVIKFSPISCRTTYSSSVVLIPQGHQMKPIYLYHYLHHQQIFSLWVFKCMNHMEHVDEDIPQHVA